MIRRTEGLYVFLHITSVTNALPDSHTRDRIGSGGAFISKTVSIQALSARPITGYKIRGTSSGLPAASLRIQASGILTIRFFALGRPAYALVFKFERSQKTRHERKALEYRAFAVKGL